MRFERKSEEGGLKTDNIYTVAILVISIFSQSM